MSAKPTYEDLEQRGRLLEEAESARKREDNELWTGSILCELSGIPIQGYDSERRVTFWNPASVDVYGYSREEAMGVRLEDLLFLNICRKL